MNSIILSGKCIFAGDALHIPSFIVVCNIKCLHSFILTDTIHNTLLHYFQLFYKNLTAPTCCIVPECTIMNYVPSINTISFAMCTTAS